MSRKRPDLKPGYRVVLADHMRPIPAMGGKPAVSKDTILFVSSVTGTGYERNPFRVTATDGVHTWHFQPDDIRKIGEWTCIACGLPTHPTGRPGETDCNSACRERGLTFQAPRAPYFEVFIGGDLTGAPVSLVEFLAANADGWDGEIADLLRLAVGGEYTCGGGAAPDVRIVRVEPPTGYYVAVIDGAEPADPDPMLVTDDADRPLTFPEYSAALAWAEDNYPNWIIEHHGNGHNWKQYGLRVVSARKESQP